ncbi:S8 family serine peptidase [Ornithinimicrobium avium]|uniref:Serine protease n=1 Tax=Ornithinimicrobium avium TaxID=2283195 RepID=A0A345NPP0_9MICO|nr:S8 family serine peptidase [Ornithinimicrobium avium]AXH96998.1 serine protease [Ornithinimicrobium avium]
MARSPLRQLAAAAAALSLLAVGPALPSAGAGPDPVEPADLTVVDGAVTHTGTVRAHKSLSGSLAHTPRALLDREDDTLIPVMIKLDHDGSASYAGGLDGLAATSPRVTGRPITGHSRAERAYTAYQQRNEKAVEAALDQAVPGAEVGRSFRVAYGGLSATIPADSVEDVLAIDGVAAVQPDELRKPLTDSSPQFIHADEVQEALGGAPDAGAGLIYANLDTGVWPEHPSFADQGNLEAPPKGLDLECDFGDNPLTAEDDPFSCNNKLIGGYAFLDTYLSSAGRAAVEPYHSARDSEGHGTHTASTSAGNVLEHAEVLGVDRGPVRGMAPGAWVVEYKVCGVQGCFDSDTTAAVQQAIEDGVDVINFSISGGTDPYADPTELAFLDAYAAGVFVSASAGNEGPGAGTANHLSPWVTSVGASTQRREFGSTLTMTAGADTYEVGGVTITQGAGPLPVVMSADAPYNDPMCLDPAPAGTFEGQIVACRRGTNARVEKGYNVLQGGAAGMILYNPSLADVETDNHWLPTIHVADGTDLEAFMDGHDDVLGQFTAGVAQDGQGDVMAAFSSRGPAGLFVKPDVTAPGVQILAGMTPTPDTVTGGPPGEIFQAIAGTSMSSPHVAGSALLVRAVHPDWTPGQIRSALMTSSVTDVVKEDLTTPADAFDMGAGRIDVAAAADVVLTVDETAGRLFQLGGDPLTAVDLNLPSINAPTMPGTLTTTRTVTNTSSRMQQVDVSAQAPADSTITVSPRKFNLRPGRSVDLMVTISSTAPLGEQRFGSVLLTPKHGGAGLHLPVAFVHTQGDVGLTQSCDPAEIPRQGTTTCTVQAVNQGPEEQRVSLTTSLTNELKLAGVEGATATGPRSVTATATLAGNRPGVPAVEPGSSVAGFLPLAAFGIKPFPVGDEDLVNFNVPSFEFAGRTYTLLGVDSNGYSVVGGGTEADNNCCSIPEGPDAAPPNNVLAPFWTDLDGTGTDGIYISVLTDGVSSWLVVEHETRVWGTTDVVPMQTWIGVNGVEDISYAYDPADLPADPGQSFLVGAENALGEGDMSATVPTGDLVVSSTPPTPGGTLTYTVDVRGLRGGTGVVTSTMTSPQLPGTTVVRTKVKVV